jgi:hypothetical protein
MDLIKEDSPHLTTTKSRSRVTTQTIWIVFVPLPDLRLLARSMIVAILVTVNVQRLQHRWILFQLIMESIHRLMDIIISHCRGGISRLLHKVSVAFHKKWSDYKSDRVDSIMQTGRPIKG